MSQSKGKIVQVIGPVVDVSFEQGGSELPKIFDALEIKRENGQVLILECQQHVGEQTVRCVAMDSTDGLSRGMEVFSTGKAISMPVGDEIKGRLLNVIGEAIDGIGSIPKDRSYEIHKDPPRFEDLSTVRCSFPETVGPGLQ